MKIARTIENFILHTLDLNKIAVVYGPRQAGKTTLVKHILDNWDGPSRYLLCDDSMVRDALSKQETAHLHDFIHLKKGLVVIDEAQRVPNIGLTLKILHDTLPDLRIIATGSSSFELANKIQEPLTGRAIEHHLHPLSYNELYEHAGDPLIIRQRLENFLRFGTYPGIQAKDNISDRDKEQLLHNISSQYLFKDILSYEGIRKPELLEKLLKLLAVQVGSEVSYTELANTLDTSKQTVESYIKILEQAFIVFSVTPFHKNLRSELTKKRKIYFHDIGIRNAVLGNHGPLDTRTDTGAIFENFVVAERMKLLDNTGHHASLHFWRTYDGQELDLIEKEGTRFHAFEIKRSTPKSFTPPAAWKNGYPNVTVAVIHSDNLPKHLIP